MGRSGYMVQKLVVKSILRTCGSWTFPIRVAFRYSDLRHPSVRHSGPQGEIPDVSGCRTYVTFAGYRSISLYVARQLASRPAVRVSHFASRCGLCGVRDPDCCTGDRCEL